MEQKRRARLLAITVIAAATAGCGNSHVEEVRCVTSQAGQCEQLGPEAFNEGDDKYDCHKKVIEVVAGPVLTTDPRITSWEGSQSSCCYLVKIDKEEGRICASGRPLDVEGEIRAAGLCRGGVSWA